MKLIFSSSIMSLQQEPYFDKADAIYTISGYNRITNSYSKTINT